MSWKFFETTINPFIQTHGRRRTLDRDDLNLIHSIPCVEPGLYLDEIHNKLRTFRDVEVSIATTSDTQSLGHGKQMYHQSLRSNGSGQPVTWQIEMAQYEKSVIPRVSKRPGFGPQTSLRLG
jgi:hypothetical protein